MSLLGISQIIHDVHDAVRMSKEECNQRGKFGKYISKLFSKNIWEKAVFSRDALHELFSNVLVICKTSEKIWGAIPCEVKKVLSLLKKQVAKACKDPEYRKSLITTERITIQPLENGLELLFCPMLEGCIDPHSLEEIFLLFPIDVRERITKCQIGQHMERSVLISCLKCFPNIDPDWFMEHSCKYIEERAHFFDEKMPCLQDRCKRSEIVQRLSYFYYEGMEEEEFFLLFYSLTKGENRDIWPSRTSLGKKEQGLILSIVNLLPLEVQGTVVSRLQERVPSEHLKRYLLNMSLESVELFVPEDERIHFYYFIKEIQQHIHEKETAHVLGIIHSITKLPKESIVSILQGVCGLCTGFSGVEEIYQVFQALLCTEEHKREPILGSISMLSEGRFFHKVDLLIYAYKVLEEEESTPLSYFFRKKASEKDRTEGIILFLEILERLDRKGAYFLIDAFMRFFSSEENYLSNFFNVLNKHVRGEKDFVPFIQALRSIKIEKARKEIILTLGAIWDTIEEENKEEVVHFLDSVFCSVQQDLIKIGEREKLGIVRSLCAFLVQNKAVYGSREEVSFCLHRLFEERDELQKAKEIFNALYRVEPFEERVHVIQYVAPLCDPSFSASDVAALIQRVEEMPRWMQKKAFPLLSFIQPSDRNFFLTVFEFLLRKGDQKVERTIQHVLENDPSSLKKYLLINVLKVRCEKRVAKHQEVEVFTKKSIELLSSLISSSMGIVPFLHLIKEVEEIPNGQTEEILSDVVFLYEGQKEPFKDLMVYFLRCMQEHKRKTLMAHIRALYSRKMPKKPVNALSNDHSHALYSDFLKVLEILSDQHEGRGYFGKCVAKLLRGKNKPFSCFFELFEVITLENSFFPSFDDFRGCLFYFEQLSCISEDIIGDISLLLDKRKTTFDNLYKLLAEIHSIPKGKHHYVLRQVKELLHRSIPVEGVVSLIGAIKNLSRGDCASIVENVKRLAMQEDPRNVFCMSAYDMCWLIHMLQRVPSHDERVDIVDHALYVAKVPINPQEKLAIVSLLMQVPREERRALVQDVNRFCDLRIVFGKQYILDAMRHIEPQLRRELTEEILTLFTEHILFGTLAAELFSTISRMDEKERVLAIERLRPLMRGKNYIEISQLFFSVTKVFPLHASVLLCLLPEELCTREALHKLQTMEGTSLETYRQGVLTSLEKKLVESSSFWANFLIHHYGAMGLSFDHLMVQRAIDIDSAYSVTGWKNPSRLYKTLLQASFEPVDFTPPPLLFKEVPIQIDLRVLSKMAGSFQVERKDLPCRVTKASWGLFISLLQKKIEKDLHNAEAALFLLGTNWTEVGYPLFYDHENYLRNLLQEEGIVTEQEAQWRAVLQALFDMKNIPIEGKFFTEQEENFIKTIMGIHYCQQGKDAGIAFAYSLLHKKYHYPVVFEKPRSPDELFYVEKKEKALQFAEEVLKKNSCTTVASWIGSLLQEINKNTGEGSCILSPIIAEEMYWDHTEDYSEYRLNDRGAKKALLEVAKRRLHPFIIEVLRGYLRRECDGLGIFMRTLLQEDVVEQSLHQAAYLQNLIGPIIGTTKQIIFDLHTGVLHAAWEEKTREDVLAAFFEHITIEGILDAFIRGLEIDSEKRLFIEVLLEKTMFLRQLTHEDVLVILEKIGYIKRL